MLLIVVFFAVTGLGHPFDATRSSDFGRAIVPCAVQYSTIQDIQDCQYRVAQIMDDPISFRDTKVTTATR